jgi:SSS family solute:Na+ symporter
MQILDWAVIGTYLLLMLLLALWLGRRQSSRRDYYLGGGTLPSWTLAVSIIATQCSTNSLLGAPAFVGFVEGGGMLWLQYELAVPLAMIGLAVLFAPIKGHGTISIYAFLETRLGHGARQTASACFLFFRGVATGVTVYGVSAVLALITGLEYWAAVLLLMAVTIAYDVLGGMRAVVLSDVIQMVLLTAAVAVALVWLAPDLLANWHALAERTHPLALDWGVRGEQHYGLWPMLFGGLFLYLAYYGCDQSQAQRLLAAHDERALHRVLILNGLLRFPLVFAYCLLGLALAAYALSQPDFIASLPRTELGTPNLNLVFPTFVLREFAPGFAGLAIVGLFAAAMSSIDSALNSLSASTVEDFLPRAASAERSFFRLSKILTLAWGLFAVALSFAVEHIAPTVLEAINKIGSMANGPLLALFIIAAFLPRIGGAAALSGFAAAIALNLWLWLFIPELSWLWWNPIGCCAALAVAAAAAALRGASPLTLQRVTAPPRQLATVLTLAFVAMSALLVAMQGIHA